MHDRCECYRCAATRAPFTPRYEAAGCQSVVEKGKGRGFADLDRVILSNGATFGIPLLMPCKDLSVGWVHQGMLA